MTATFQDLFHQAPVVEAQACGRVNLLGEHTDYNDGFVLPTVIPQTTTVQIGPSEDAYHHFYSTSLNEHLHLATATTAAKGFGRYVIGCLKVLEHRGIQIPPLNVWISSSIPIGAGLSSSAALEIAILRGVRTLGAQLSLLSLDLSDIDLAQIAQQAEHQYAGVKCGIMDQMAVSLADAQHLLFLDTRTLAYERIPIPTGAAILVLDSGIPRTLAESGYNQRRTECEAAAAMLGVTALRDVTHLAQLQSLPPLLLRRARHVLTENQRVLAAKQDLPASEFGRLMNDSHTSLRDDYEVSVAGLDCLVEILQQTPGVFGARLTGAGFGGACVALVASAQVEAIATLALHQYERQGFRGQLLVPAHLL
jgi:galactokinase